MLIETIFKIICGACASLFSIVFVKDVVKNHIKDESGNVYTAGAIGAITNFLDALGIGSFATATVLLRTFKQIPDRLLPGTLNVMSVLPCYAEAIIYIGIIHIDYITLIALVAGTGIGGSLGAKFVSRLPEKTIRTVIAIALFIAATSMFLHMIHFFPSDYGVSDGFRGIKLAIATAASVIIGILCNMGIGIFAPYLTLTYFLGMTAKATFPLMMTAAAASCTSGALTFIKEGAYNRKVSFSMGIFGVIGVIVAAYIVKNLPLNVLNWIVIGVIYYTSATLFMSRFKSTSTPNSATATE